MADITGAAAYFAGTTRNAAWGAYDKALRQAALQEAVGMVGCLTFARRPPQLSLDQAAYEQALCLLDGRDQAGQQAARAIASGVRSRGVLDASESYASAAEREQGPGWIDGLYYCPHALMWLQAYLAPGGGIRTGRVVVRDGY